MPICYDTYRRAFHKEHITFGIPTADMCDLCEFAKEHLKVNHLPNAPACIDCGKIGLHRKYGVQARRHYELHANSTAPEDTGIFTVDMQAVLIIPILKGKNYFSQVGWYVLMRHSVPWRMVQTSQFYGMRPLRGVMWRMLRQHIML